MLIVAVRLIKTEGSYDPTKVSSQRRRWLLTRGSVCGVLEGRVLKREGGLFWPARCELLRGGSFLAEQGLDKFSGFFVSLGFARTPHAPAGAAPVHPMRN